jgi:hypothetical protein
MRHGIVPALLLAGLLILLAIVEAMGAEVPWADYIAAVDQAVAARDARATTQALGRAYNAALGSRRWEGLLVVGDAAVRAGRALDMPEPALRQARRAYMTGLLRARDVNAIDGVLRACQAFAAIGDASVVAQCLRIAEDLAISSRDSRILADVRAATARLTDHSFAAGEHRLEP